MSPDFRDEITQALSPGHFFLGGGTELAWEHVAAEEVSWEIFQGRLLDASQTRDRRTFEAWNVYRVEGDTRSVEPLLSLKFDPDEGQVYIVRAIYSYAWEGYHAGDNVYLSREAKKWLRELVTVIEETDQLCPAVERGLMQAVFGLSRLPLTSVEAPLPGFTLGELAYFPVQGTEAMRTPQELIERTLRLELPGPLRSRVLESVLRATPAEQLEEITNQFVGRWQDMGESPGRIADLLRAVFDDVALSPYTDFVGKTLKFLGLLERRGDWTAEQHADFLGGLLRHLVRHLTAYDLVTFHHRGANYPDALLLDMALRSFLDLADRQPELFMHSRLRRRAVRQGVLLRLWYEGQPVPDQPTSPGENSRVLPPDFPRIPEEQITDPSKRTRKLFDGDPLLPRLAESALLRQSLADLDEPAELQELGIALYLDRPLGLFKRPGEPDTTPLLSYEAFSRRIAERRLKFLEERVPMVAEPERWEKWHAKLREELPRKGISLQPSPMPMRPGVASLADTFRVADDFVLLATTQRSAAEFLTSCNVGLPEERWLIVGGPFVGKPPGIVAVFDAAFRVRYELEIQAVGELRVRSAEETS
jgi:hypothetical protein